MKNVQMVTGSADAVHFVYAISYEYGKDKQRVLIRNATVILKMNGEESYFGRDYAQEHNNLQDRLLKHQKDYWFDKKNNRRST